MLASHRRRHLILWLILGPLILIGFALGLSARRPFPVQDDNPAVPAIDRAEEVSP